MGQLDVCHFSLGTSMYGNCRLKKKSYGFRGQNSVKILIVVVDYWDHRARLSHRGYFKFRVWQKSNVREHEQLLKREANNSEHL